jgi:PKD repeat protein
LQGNCGFNLAFVPYRTWLLAALALLAIAVAAAPNTSSAATNDIPVSFVWAPASPTPGQVVTFTASASPPSGAGPIKSYDWDLNGDGSIDKHGSVATWSYPAPGPVAVNLRVKGKGPHRGEVSHALTVQPAAGGGGGGGGGPVPKPPVASFTFSPVAPVVGQPVLFTSNSSDPDGSLIEQVWDLSGDSNYDNGGGPTAMRSFAEAGEYVVGLRVTDNDHLVSFDSKTVTVLPGPTSVTQQGGTVRKPGGPRLLSPFPVVRVAGRIVGRGTIVRVLSVRAPAGAQVAVRCAGHGCPFHKVVRTIQVRTNSRTTATIRVHKLERLLKPGVRVRVYVTKTGGVYGKYTKIRFRAGKPPARSDSCLSPERAVPLTCPSF